LKKRKKT